MSTDTVVDLLLLSEINPGFALDLLALAAEIDALPTLSLEATAQAVC